MQATNKRSKSGLRKKKAGWDISEKESWCWWASLCRMVREGLSDSSVTLEQQHDWSEETTSQAEGIGRNWSTLVSAKGRDIAKSTYDGHIHLLFGSEEKGKGKPVLYAWPGNNPMLPLGALPLGGQFWVLLSVAFLGWRQSLQKYLHWPDFCEQSWIRKMWFRILLTLKVVLEGDYKILKGCWIVRGGEGLPLSHFLVSPKRLSSLRWKGG